MRCRLFVALIACIAFSGCDSPGPTKPAGAKSGSGHSHSHSHDHENLTLKDAVAKTLEMATKIQAAGVKGDFDAAHDEIHDIGHLLEDLVALAKSESKSDEIQASVKSTAESLFSSMGKVDKALHDGKTVKYEEIKDAYETGLANLKSISEKL
jgi:hypothetical protein